MIHLADNLTVIAPAFVAGLLVLLTHVPLGREVVRRGIIFIDLAIAQVAGLGLILAAHLGLEPGDWTLQLLVTASALAGAGLASLLEKHAGRHQEAMIGLMFVLAASGSLLLLANNPHGGEHLQALLAGQILWVSWEQLPLPALLSAGLLALWVWKRHLLQGRWFYLLFAIAITQSVQLVGVLLVFSSLVMPALATIHLGEYRGAALGWLLGMAAYGGGLLLSLASDLPASAVIVWALFACALATRLVTGRKAG